MIPSKNCYDLIERLELFNSHAYWDVTGWACGYGTHSPDITAQTVWTEDEAHERLVERVLRVARFVSDQLEVTVSQGQFDALVSFTYNIGEFAFKHSHVLEGLNLGQFDCVPDEMARWVHVNGEVNQGLVARRQAEIALFKSKTQVTQETQQTKA